MVKIYSFHIRKVWHLDLFDEEGTNVDTIFCHTKEEALLFKKDIQKKIVEDSNG
jgi:hypothetical protein